MLRLNKTFLALLLFPLLTISAMPAVAQRRPATPRKAPPPAQVAEPVESLDTLLADEQYRIFSEVRNVGTLVRSQAFNEFLEPLVQFVEAPEHFSRVLNWMRAHAELLAGSRLCMVSWPSKKTLPEFVISIELASAADAKKLEAELRAFLPKLDPKPKPKPSPSPSPSPQPNTEEAQKPGMFAQLQIQQVGALVLLSDKRISLPDLKPARRRLLAENSNFVLTRNRFASEPIFVYADFKAIEKDAAKIRQRFEEEARLREEREAAQPPLDPAPDSIIEDHPTAHARAEDIVPIHPEAPPIDAPAPVERTNAEAELAASFGAAIQPLSMALFGGRAKYPEALGVALAFEGDSYTLRGLVVNSPENRSLPVPFVPQLVSGPAFTPSSPNVLPGDAELFVALSLDYAQIYEAMIKAFADQPWLMVMNSSPMKRPASPFSTFEEKIGLKVKEDLLPLLGDEMGFILAKPPAVPPPKDPTRVYDEDVYSVRMPELLPVIAISIKDREAVKKLIPKVFESMGLKGAAMLGHSEKSGDAEIVSYASMFSYAFIGDFLIFAPDPALTRWAVDSYVSNNTLSSNSKFRSATRWQGRQVQGQVYVNADLVERFVFTGKSKAQALASDNQPVEPLTYMLSNEGLGPIHEAHVPRSFVQMVVAGITSKANESPIETNESIAKNMLRTIMSAQATFRKNKGDGRYGSLDELSAEGLITKDLLERYGYKIELLVLSNRFEVTATPVEYGKTGKRSFYIDETGILRGGDHAGGAATLSDRPINE